MKKSFNKIGRVILTVLIALSSVGLPTSVAADSKHPAYMYADADELVYINQTGLSEAELKNIEVFEVIENMNVIETTWDELDAKNGEYVLQLRDHNPTEDLYGASTHGRYDGYRKQDQRVYAFRVDPLSDYQPCPKEKMYIEMLGLEEVETQGAPGFPGFKGNLYGGAGDFNGRTYVTNQHTFLTVDANIEREQTEFNIDFRADRKSFKPERDLDKEFDAMNKNLKLYVHYMNDGKLEKKLVDESLYTKNVILAKDEDTMTRTEFVITRDKSIEFGSLVGYESVLELEENEYYTAEGRQRSNAVEITMKADYRSRGAIAWSRDAKLDSYTIDGRTVESHVEHYGLKKRENNINLLDCFVTGEAEININPRVLQGPPGNGGQRDPNNEIKLNKVALGNVTMLNPHEKEVIDGAEHFVFRKLGMEFEHKTNNRFPKRTWDLTLTPDDWVDYDNYKVQETVTRKFNDSNLVGLFEKEFTRHPDQRNAVEREMKSTDIMYVIANDNGKLKLVGPNTGKNTYIDTAALGYEYDDVVINDVVTVFNVEQQEFKVNKVWEGKSLDEAEFILKADGVEVDRVKVNKDNWEGSFGLHPLYSVDESALTEESIGNKTFKVDEIKYTVEEVEVEGFESTVVDNGDGSFTVTNKELVPQTPLVPATTKVKVEKKWRLFAKESQPVTVNLLADGKKVDSVELSAKNDWTHTFTDLKVVNNITDEKAIVYTVEEVSIDGFDVIVEGNQKDGFVITNKEIIPQTPLVPAKTSVKVAKQWELYKQDKQPVTVNLLADGEVVDTVELSAKNDWNHTFTDLNVVNDVKDEKAIVYTVEEISIDGFETTIEGNQKDGFIITNKEIVPQTPLVPAKTSVKVEKQWELYKKDKQPVTVNLLADGKKVDSVVLSEDNSWNHTFTDLKVVNDVKDEKAIVYTVEEITLDGFEVTIEGSQKDGFVITNKEIIPQTPLTPAKTKVSVEKKWSLFQLKKQPVTINLLADGTKVDSVVLSKDNDWKHTFTDLKVVNNVKDDKAIVYTVEEVRIDGFETIIEGNQKDGFIVTNKEIIPQTPLTPAKTFVNVEKKWSLFQLKKQPVTVNLLADGTKVDSIVLSKDNSWKHTFTDLKVVNDVKDEKAIVYTVEEVRIDGFETVIEGNQKDGFIITNKEIVPQTPLVPATTSVEVTKEWELYKKDTQPVTVNLLADGTKVDSVELSEANSWTHTFTDLKVVNDVKDEKAIVYTVEEVALDGFDVTIEGNQKDGFIITNKEVIPQTPLVPAKTKVSVEKQWELYKKDKQPVTVNLLADGEVVDTVELSNDNDWKHTFTDLKVVNDVKDDKAIVYTVEEVEVKGFETVIEGNQVDGFVITNKEIIPQTPLTPAKTKVSVEKQWSLFELKKQPVTVNLLADGEIVDSVVLSTDNNWKHTFTDLKVVNDVKDDKAIVYTVEEIEIEGFESIIEGNQKDGFVITNKEIIEWKPVIPAKTKVSVEKQWSLFQKDKQPVTVNLLADGVQVDSVVLSDSNEWKHTFKNLNVVNDVKDEKAIEYTVEEVAIEGFETVIEGNQKEGFVITNTEIVPQTPLVPAKTSVSVAKQWNLFQKDKQAVTVNLLADGEVVDSIELSDNNEWKHTFADLKVVNDVKDEKAIEYTVEEVKIDGFESIIEGNQVDGFMITNNEIIPQFPLTPAKTSITVNKEWQLYKENKQPVTIDLLADGEVIDTVELSSDNDWTHTFTDLKVVNDIADESAIEYSVNERKLDGFDVEITQEGNVFTVLNKEIVPQTPLVPATTSVSIVKQWELMVLNKQPVVVELLANGEVIDNVTLSDDNNWAHTFTDLKVVNDIADESAIEYTVREITPEGFLSIIEKGENGELIITNSEIPVPNITADKTVDKAEIKPGEIVEYTITITNDGTGNKFITIKDPMTDLIDYVTFVDEVMIGDTSYTFSELMNGIEMEIGAGHTIEVVFKLQFNEDAEGEFLNVAYVDELEPEVPVTVIPEEPNCDEPQDPNNPDPNCPIIPEEPNCDEPQDPNNPDPNCPIVPETPEETPETPEITEKEIPRKPGRPVDTGDLRRPQFMALVIIGLSALFIAKKED